jgi:hypothetical protein
MQTNTETTPSIRVSGYTEIVVPEGADSAQLTALYQQAYRAKLSHTERTPHSNGSPESLSSD